MIRVSRLFTYPVKSLAGVETSRIELTNRGLKYDRRWLLIDDDGVHITQREFEKLSLFRQSIKEEGIQITFQGDSILVPFEYAALDRAVANIWGDEVEVNVVNEKLNDWFSDKLGVSARLVHQPDDSRRFIDEKYRTAPDQIVSAADGYPILIISEESIKHLNHKLDSPIQLERFRPNIVVNGVLNPHEEDEWGELTIGKIRIKGVKNCARCQVVNIDPMKGISGKEPLRTLASYRKVGSKVLFGRNFLPLTLGQLQVGDVVSST